MRKLKAVISFVRWALPRGDCSLRFYVSLLRILLCGRQSIYNHFKSLKAATSPSPPALIKGFFSSLASIRVPASDKEPGSVPARLLVRLLRTIYLTEVLPYGGETCRQADPGRGFITHQHFSYGESLSAAVKSRTKNGDLE